MEHQSDHDLLIRLDENVRNLYIEFKSSNTSIQGVVNDHEARIRSLEKTQTQIMTWGTVGIILLNVVGFLIGKYL